MAKAYVLRLTVSIVHELPLLRSLPLVLHRLPRGRENVGAPTFKVLLEGYLVANKYSNGVPDVLKDKRLAFGIRMGVFPK
jgi:hypothetical protein